MAKRFTPEEDRLIAAYYDAAGAENLAMDTGRSAEAIKRRSEKLRRSGCFDLYEQEHKAGVLFNVAAGHMSAYDALLFHNIDASA